MFRSYYRKCTESPFATTTWFFLEVREVKILEIAVIAAVNVDATEKTMVEDTAVIAQFFNVIQLIL